MILTIRPATVDDLAYVGRYLREEDRRELETSTGGPALEAVARAAAVSRETYSIRFGDDDRPHTHASVVFGVSDSFAPGFGIVWLVATREMARGSLSVLRESRAWLNHLGRHYEHGLHTLCDSRNDLHVRWLQLTGFTLRSLVDIHGTSFHHATRTPYV